MATYRFARNGRAFRISTDGESVWMVAYTFGTDPAPVVMPFISQWDTNDVFSFNGTDIVISGADLLAAWGHGCRLIGVSLSDLAA